MQKLSAVGDRKRALVRFARSCQRFTCLGRPRPRPFPLACLLRGLRALCLPSVRQRRVSFSLILFRPRVAIRTSRGLLSRILVGLLGGTVRTLRKRTSKGVHVRISARGGRLLVQIASGNPNIPSSLVRSVFIPFFAAGTAKDNVKLDLSQRVVQVRKKRLSITSLPCQRAYFAISLPMGPWRLPSLSFCPQDRQVTRTFKKLVVSFNHASLRLNTCLSQSVILIITSPSLNNFLTLNGNIIMSISVRVTNSMLRHLASFGSLLPNVTRASISTFTSSHRLRERTLATFRLIPIRKARVRHYSRRIRRI